MYACLMIIIILLNLLLSSLFTKGNIVLDLQNQATFIHKMVTLQPHSAIQLQAINVNSLTSFILFQSHCQKNNATMMYHKAWSYNSSVHGTSIGLVSYLQNSDTVSSVWVTNSNDKDLSCFVAAVPHGSKVHELKPCGPSNPSVIHAITFCLYIAVADPVPGGCNVEFNVPTSPFLHLKFNPIQTVVEYQSASIGYDRLSSVQMSCDISMYYISYEFYVIFLPEGHYELTEFSSGLTTAMSWNSLNDKARKIKPYVTTPAKRLLFSSFPGQGVIYNIVSKYKSKINNSDIFYHSSYVPYVTYGCSFSDEVDGCYSINRTFTYVFCICAAIVGMIMCFAGHHFFKLEMFVAGFLAAALLTFILLIKYTSWTHTDREIITMVCGVIGGILWLSLWWFLGIPVISSLLVGLELGYLASSIIFFTPAGDVELLRNNFNYWMTFAIGVIFVPVILIYFTKLLSIIFCAVLGSFGLIVAIDRYIRTTLSYIILNVVKRSIYGSLDKVNQVLPFQRNDIILSVAWVILSIVGIVVQHIITKDKPPFPPAPYQIWQRNKESRLAIRRRMLRRLRSISSANEEIDPLVDPRRTLEPGRSYGSVD
ncbi:Transmembrane 7 superfamily member 3 [Nymphon striatum]|nr:Transmembrane 7 superfamily member 3 [Nymphon striatum]